MLRCGRCWKKPAAITPFDVENGAHSTAVREEYNMWVMPMSAFVELDRLQPHQILSQAQKIVPFNENMTTVFIPLPSVSVIVVRVSSCRRHHQFQSMASLFRN